MACFVRSEVTKHALVRSYSNTLQMCCPSGRGGGKKDAFPFVLLWSPGLILYYNNIDIDDVVQTTKMVIEWLVFLYYFAVFCKKDDTVILFTVLPSQKIPYIGPLRSILD